MNSTSANRPTDPPAKASVGHIQVPDRGAFTHSLSIESPLVAINYETCARIAALIASSSIPKDREEVLLRGIPPALVGNFFIFLVAICHQTSPQGKPKLEGQVGGELLIGWDYLIAKFEQRARGDNSLLDPTRWSQLSGDQISAMFADDQLGNLLTRNDERAQLVQDLGVRLSKRGWLEVDKMLSFCEGRIATGDPNLIEVLSQFHAYRDPVYKKSLFFLALMRNSGRWQFVDNDLMAPPVDYHETRGHLRIGTVVIRDASLLRKIRTGAMVTSDEDIAIRTAIFRAILLISDLSGLRDSSRLHYYFWNIFRAVCLRKGPRCVAASQPPSLPQRYRVNATNGGKVFCPFESVCKSANKPDPILEHNCLTDFY